MRHNTINYLEIPVSDIAKTKAFFGQVFQWQFKDYGDEYTCFLDVGIDGGFYLSAKNFSLAHGSPLIVLCSDNLAITEASITQHGGKIVKPVFSFPGGRRFHFSCPCGNEYAVWSE
ncbi:VOC family protein [Shewanella maritima]|uniref:VOC family protein n=1 Tax=Shewanella maritima TaxID=2520507 RepID=A0A411PLI3_9GAMM|nr:VOC family protein [Shewanella maritima]QBF84344.1 VOC family protein [Shewanella maritima]